MTSTDRDEELLTEYRAELDDAETRLDELQQDVLALQQIVTGLEARVGRRAGTTQDEGQTVLQVPHHANRVTLMDQLRTIMADGQRRHVSDVVQALAERGVSAETRRERQSVVNRLYDLTKQGHLTRPERGVYELATPNGTGDAPNSQDPG